VTRKTVEKTVSYDLPKGYKYSEYNIDKGYFRCPNCGKFGAFKHRHKKIGECLHCWKTLQFNERSTMFIRVEGHES